MKVKQTWAIEDHLCKQCGGRILRCVTGNGMTGGGNPIYRCADCGASGAAMGPSHLCWCGFAHKFSGRGRYKCLPFTILEEHPEYLRAFQATGFNPARGGEVGIVLVDSLSPTGE